MSYLVGQTNLAALPYPAIVGVRLGGPKGAGHFIAILGKDQDKYIVGDPLTGREDLDASQLQDRYFFTGFSMVAKPSTR